MSPESEQRPAPNTDTVRATLSERDSEIEEAGGDERRDDADADESE